MRSGQPSRLRAKQQRVARLVRHLVVVLGRLGGEGENAVGVKRRKAGVQVAVDLHLRKIVIVQPSAFEVPIVKVETQRLNKVEHCACVRRKPDGVAGVAGNDRVIKDDVKRAHKA